MGSAEAGLGACHARHNPNYVQHVVARGLCAVNVWGVLTRQGLGPLVRIDGSLTSRAYAEIIDQVLLPYILGGPFPDECFTFQQTRSPIHTSRVVRELQEDRCIMELDWPPKGADMNPIENALGNNEKRNGQSDLPQRQRGLSGEAVLREWEHLKSTTIADALYASMPQRMSEVVSARGEFTRY
ncbi:hypothetical protein HPB47_017306 [Ixodes persulcatus]|uniref:Uncharacterized protein n=1 Tax=Ixodes persulcatus TaxID=34615 RepID=A0AC60QNN8_IXOPE|nr:hypothetical protein HPB47_017306 [Ixodes persulcatus]